MAIFPFVKMAAVHHARFYKIEILSADKVKRVTVRYYTKFDGDLSGRCVVMAI